MKFRADFSTSLDWRNAGMYNRRGVRRADRHLAASALVGRRAIARNGTDERRFEMRSYELYARFIDWPGPAATTEAMALGVALIVLSVTFLSLGRIRWIARAMGAVGVLCLLFAMLLIHDQTVVVQNGIYVVARQWRYPEAARFQARVALLGLPAASIFVMLQVLWATRRRQRSTVPTLLRDGRAFLVRGELDAALASLNEALTIFPHLAEGRYLRARVNEALDQIDEAVVDLDQAISANPNMAPARLARGRLRALRGELDGAGEDFDRFLSLRPNDIEGLLNRGKLLAKQGRELEAVADFQRVLKLTNHSDYADPAREYLKRLHAEPTIDPTAKPSNSEGPMELLLDRPLRYEGHPTPLPLEEKP